MPRPARRELRDPTKLYEVAGHMLKSQLTLEESAESDALTVGAIGVVLILCSSCLLASDGSTWHRIDRPSADLAGRAGSSAFDTAF